MAIIMVLSTVGLGLGAVSAANSNTLQGMDANKSIGYVGVQNYTNDQNGSHVNGLCVDEYTYINFGDSVPVTTGTSGVPASNSVKLLIVNNYRDNMTQQQGADLQNAIWFFTNNKTTTDPAVLALINSTQANSTTVSDANYKQILSTTKTLVNETNTSTNVLVGTTSTSSSITIPTGQNTTIQTIVGKTCTKVITTVVSFFTTQTTTNTTDTYLNTTTITDFYQTTVNSLIFNFNSYVGNCKQKLIFFTDTPDVNITNSNNSTVIPVYSNNSTINVVNTYFNTTTITSKCIPFPPVNNTTTTNTTTPTKTTNNTTAITTPASPLNKAGIAMQHTGVPIAPLGTAILAVIGSIVAARKYGW